MMKTGNILRLLGKRARCDPDVLELLYKLFSATIYNAAHYIVNDRGLAEDITQETFLSAFTGLENIKHPEKIEAWLVRTAINKAINLVKRNQRIITLNEDYAAEEQEIDVLVEQLAKDELISEVSKAVRSVPLQYQEILYFKYYKDFTIKHIAETLEIPEGTVKSRLRKAQSLVAQLLKERVDDINDTRKVVR